jgi:hypothetical protein
MWDALASIIGISLAASAVFVLIGLLIYLTCCRASHPVALRAGILSYLP